MSLELFVIIPIAAGAYLATNLDNLTLLAVLLARYPERRDTVIAGFLVSAGLLAGCGFAISYATAAVPVKYLGLLGLVPITIGLVGVSRLIRERSGRDASGPQSPRIAGAAFVATVGSQLGNGSDTLITFAALFADSMPTAALCALCLPRDPLAAVIVLSFKLGRCHPRMVVACVRVRSQTELPNE